MKAQDYQLREALVGILATCGLPFKDVNVSGNPALQFDLGAITHRFSYAADADNTGIIRKLVNLLLAAGFQPGQSNSQPAAARRVGKNQQLIDQVFGSFKNLPLVQPCIESEPVKTPSPLNTPSPFQADRTSNVKPVVQSSGFIVHRPTAEFVPADVYLIKVGRDLMASAGDYLVIPIHNPEAVTSMTAAECENRYQPRSFSQPSASGDDPSGGSSPDELDVSPLSSKPPGAYTEAAVEPVLAAQQHPFDASAEVARTLARKPLTVRINRQPMPAEAEPEAEPDPESDDNLEGKYIPPWKVSAHGVTLPAQLGRILGGIRLAMIETGRSEVSAAEAGSYMPLQDRRQISARIRLAIRDGLVNAKKSGNQHSYAYSVTPFGDRVLRVVLSHCYRNVGLEVPPFVETFITPEKN